MLDDTDFRLAFEHPLVKKMLPRYTRVVNDDHPASFQIANRIAADLDRNISNPQLWKMHDSLMEEFYEAKKLIDMNKLSIDDLEKPRFSLMDLKTKIAQDVLCRCGLCERSCYANRLEGELGECKVNGCRISSEFMHMGEEPFISPSHTIFFMGCNFHCQYCQNWDISQWFKAGVSTNPQILAHCIDDGKRIGCRNVNFVGGEPTPHIPYILEALKLCKSNQAVVWNSNFYMSEKSMQLLDGTVDVYLTDFKYGNNLCAEQLSRVGNYLQVVARNHLIAAGQAEMVIRHLVLPDHVECCTMPVLKWLAGNLRNRAVVNIMDQYVPEFKAEERLDINRKVCVEEINASINYARKLKLNCLDRVERDGEDKKDRVRLEVPPAKK